MRVVVGVLGWSCFAVALVGTLVRYIDSGNHLVIAAAAGAWVLAAFAVPAFVLHLASRHWVAAGLAAVLVIVQVVVYGPLFVGRTPPRDGTELRVMTQNMYLGRADAAQIVQHVRSERVDVLMLEELTPDAVGRLARAGLNDALRFSYATPFDGAAGTGIWSRFPLTDEAARPIFSMATLTATVSTPAGSATLVALHAAGPWPASSTHWQLDLQQTQRLLAGLPDDAPVVVAGDFNATLDTPRFRSLLTGGYRDGAEQAGSGLMRTWPADRSIPPTIGIDHVLTRGAVATSAAAVRTRSTDHLGLVVTVVLPP